MNKSVIFLEIVNERKRQDRLHPKWNGDYHGLSVLMEEVGEVSKALYEVTNAMNEQDDQFWQDNLKEELIQVAAVCCRWLENMNDD